MIFIVLAVVAVGGAGYYFKIVKPKQQAADNDMEDDSEYEDDPDMPYDSDDENYEEEDTE